MFAGFLRLLALSGPEDPDGRDRLDHPEDSLPEDDRRGGEGVREAEAGRARRLLAAAVELLDCSLVQFPSYNVLQSAQTTLCDSSALNSCGARASPVF